jgi:plastocyanin
MKWTTKYQLGYFEENDYTVSSVELQRWETLDAQLYSLFAVLGNGIISGWTLLPSSGLSVAVAAGSGHVNFVSVKSTSNSVITGLLPSSRSYIYVALLSDSYWTQGASFVARTSLDTTGEVLYLGYVDTDATSVTDVNMDGRTNLGFLQLIQSLISTHRHIGGENNPSPVNLATDVQGIINQNNLPDVLDASIIQTGTIDSDRLPLIDHITQLINQGTLTHAQLDSFVEALNITGHSLMGETSTVDLLQLILALKHIYPDIDQYLINEIAYIPGISPDSYVDWDNTTATVDTAPSSAGGQHTITGDSSPGKNAYTYTWDNETEFDAGTHQDVMIDGDTVSLDTQVDTLVIDEFNDLTQWQVITDDLSSLTIALASDASTYVVPPNSAKLVVGDTTVEIDMVIKKEFDAQDWSSYKKIVMFIKTESVQHGDVYFYINDVYAGTQSSHTKVLNRNSPTINVDTLQNGWQEVTVDISSYTRTNINTIAFYVSSQQGWDTAIGFDLNLDNIYLTTGNSYKESGYARVIFGSDFYYDFWRVRWDAEIPTDSQSAGLIFKVRTRVGNTLSDLAQSTWSSYTTTSGDDISLPAPALYKYIEIESYFGASTDFSRTAVLRKLYLDYYTSDVENSFNYDSADAWDSGSKFNIDTSTTPGSMLISHTDEIDHVYYGTQSSAFQLDENLVTLYQITGSTLPRSTYQAQNDASPSLGLVTGASLGGNGNIFISDTDNDRVLELDRSGGLIVGLYGSFLNPPIDNYGGENGVQNSNVTSTASTTTISLNQTLNVLQAIYNSGTGILYIVFDSDLENIYDPNNTLDINKMYLKIGSQVFYLNDSTVELLGVEKTKYEAWSALSTSTDSNAQFINQFAFNSHTLKITLNGADRTQLNYMVDQEAPSIVISSPYEQERLTGDVTVKFLLYNYALGTGGTGNLIRVTLDSSVITDTRATSITFSGLTVGSHTIKAQLVDGDGTLNTNIEAIAESSFVVYNGAYTSPYISIQSPKPNQIYSASPVVVEFNVENFPILATGTHLMYVVDSGAPVNYYSELPITINDLVAGEHEIRLYLVDSRGNEISSITYGPYCSVMVSFIIGLNSNAVTKLYIDPQAIYSASKSFTTGYVRQYVDVGNVYFTNIYSPIDVQVIPAETSIINQSGLPSILVAKLRSPSWTTGLASSNTEFINAIAASVNTASSITTSIAEMIFKTPKFLDGYSVVQLSASNGELLMSNNEAVFAHTKEEAKTILGSAEKLGSDEVVIGDSVNKRAIIVSVDLSTGKSQVSWEYNSDKYIPDFHIVTQQDVVIEIRDDVVSPAELFIRQGTNVIWENNSSKPISIYSGKTDLLTFNLDPDLTLYGSEFYSGTLQPGERYSYKFVTVGGYNYFAYPDILVGEINVTTNRISSRDQFVVLESDSLSSPFSSRVIKVDSYGNVLWSFGEAFLCLPRDARPLLNGGVLIST